MLRSALLASAAAAASAAVPCALSNVFGDHMVLQRGPQPSVVFGFAPPGTSVTTTFQGNKYVAPTGADGVWRQALLAQPATLAPQQISFSCSTGEAFALSDVLFGDVVMACTTTNTHLHVTTTTHPLTPAQTAAQSRPLPNLQCGGQSNMRERQTPGCIATRAHTPPMLRLPRDLRFANPTLPSDVLSRVHRYADLRQGRLQRDG